MGSYFLFTNNLINRIIERERKKRPFKPYHLYWIEKLDRWGKLRLRVGNEITQQVGQRKETFRFSDT